jgi:tetratricopeptide (TPR) repeat protein
LGRFSVNRIVFSRFWPFKFAMEAGFLSNVITGMNSDKSSAEQKLSESTERLNGLLKRVSLIEQKTGGVEGQSLPKESGRSFAAGGNTSNQIWDWTSAYQSWAGYEDIDELQRSILKEQEMQKELMRDPNPVANHYHDHTEERVFFKLPEAEKLAQCERYRAVGNGLYAEGLLPKAAHNYKLALSYYDYCFPAAEEDQQQLDVLRQACLCNLSCCYLRLGELRLAQSTASQVLRFTPRHVKALFRRARASRALDEYSSAQQDLCLALQEQPNDRALLKEQRALARQIKGARIFDKQLSDKILKAEARADGAHVRTGSAVSPCTDSDGGGGRGGGGPSDSALASQLLSSDMPIEPCLPPAMWGMI